MRLLIILTILSAQTVCAQATFRASFGVYSPHQYVFEQNGSYREIYADKKKDSILTGIYEIKNNRIISYDKVDGVFIPGKEFVFLKDSSIIDIQTLNAYPISTSRKTRIEQRLDLLKNATLGTQLDLQANVVEDDSLNDWPDSKTVEVTLMNKSADTLRVLEMTCTYEDFFTTSSKENKVEQNHICYANFPKMVEILPHQSVSYKLCVGKADKEMMFRIGFYALTPNEFISERDLSHNHYRNRKSGELIWSNIIRM